MKKAMVLIMTLLMAGGLAPLFSCDVTMETGPIAATGNIQVKLFVECVHGRCPVDIEKTRLEAEGLRIVKQGQRQKAEGTRYQLDLVIALDGPQKGLLRVLRNCPKRGLQEEILEFGRQ